MHPTIAPHRNEIEVIASYMEPASAAIFWAMCVSHIIMVLSHKDEIPCYALQYGHNDLRTIMRKWLSGFALPDAKFDKLIKKAAINGNRSQCVLAHEWAIASGKTPNFNEMLINAAQHGHKDLCILAREWLDAAGIKPDFDSMLYAAEFADPVCARDICKLARKWARETQTPMKFENMIVSAVAAGHRDLCILAYKWLCHPGTSQRDSVTQSKSPSATGACVAPLLNLDFVITTAVMSGHRDFCELAHKWNVENRATTSINYDQMCSVADQFSDTCALAHKWRAENSAYLNTVLIEGAKHADPVCARDLCISAHKRGLDSGTPMNYNDMLVVAVRRGNRDLCILAHEWAHESPLATRTELRTAHHSSPIPIDFNDMLNIAAECGHRDLCELACKWTREWHSASTGANSSSTPLDFNGMLEHAARGGHRDICELAHKWGHSARSKSRMNFNLMLIGATYGNHRDLCELAREWIDEANVNPKIECMLACAAERGHRDLCILAREWLDDHNIKPNFNLMLEYAISGGHQSTCDLAREWLRESGTPIIPR